MWVESTGVENAEGECRGGKRRKTYYGKRHTVLKLLQFPPVFSYAAFPPLQTPPTFSTPVISTPALSSHVFHSFPLLRFQSSYMFSD